MNKTVNGNNQQRTEKNTFFNVLRKSVPNVLGGKSSEKKERQVICDEEKISKAVKAGVLRLYKDLAPNDKIKPINVNMIVNEAFPAFERTIGEDDFKKIKKYYGIGCNPNKSVLRDIEVAALLTRLRTVENAQFYLEDYKKLLVEFAEKLNGAPEGMTMLVKAKLVRLFYTIYVGYYYLAHDFKYLYNYVNNTGKIIVDYQEAVKNNRKNFYPEDLFLINVRLAYCCPAKGLAYQAISYELETLAKDRDKKHLFDELMSFAELEMVGKDEFISVNNVRIDRTISKIRKIKHGVHPEIGVYPMETFALEDQMRQATFDSLYKLYKELKAHKMEDFKTYEKKDTFLEESRITEKPRKFYEIEESDDPEDEHGFSISGETEKNRFINMIDYMTSQEVVLQASDGRVCDMSIYMPAFKFCEEMGYTNLEMALKDEFEVAEKIIDLDSTGAIKKFGKGMISVKELGEILGIGKKKTPEEIATKFAVDNGYVADESAIDKSLMANVVLAGNEDAFSKFCEELIDEETLKTRIGFEDEFAEMYFDLSKVEITAIEDKLQELKRTLTKANSMRKHAMLIKLYCYLVEEQIKCGPKNRAPKRNKGLKPSNLKALIAA